MDLNGNLIYAVDFDGTLSFGQFPGVGEPNDALIEFLNREKSGKPDCRIFGHSPDGVQF